MKPQQQSAIIQMEVDKRVRKYCDQWRVQTAQQMYAVVLKNLHDKHNFTPDMLVKFFEQCTQDFDCLNGKYVKIEDFYTLLRDMGIKVA